MANKPRGAPGRGQPNGEEMNRLSPCIAACLPAVDDSPKEYLLIYGPLILPAGDVQIAAWQDSDEAFGRGFLFDVSKSLLDLGGQTAFVTGAGQGGGRAIATLLARHNARVVVNDYFHERAEAVVAEIKAQGGAATAAPADVCDLTSVGAALALGAEKFGPITLLVNNAGMAGPNVSMVPGTMFWETAPGDWDCYIATNLLGVMNCCHAVLPGMLEEKRGRIVTVVSDSGRVGEARLAVYAAAKAGAAGFVRSLARETGRFGITCNAISLSSLEPPLEPDALARFQESDQSKAQLSRYIIRRYGKPDDLAAMALFLCSDAAGWITGQTYPVNGGYSVAV